MFSLREEIPQLDNKLVPKKPFKSINFPSLSMITTNEYLIKILKSNAKQ